MNHTKAHRGAGLYVTVQEFILVYRFLFTSSPGSSNTSIINNSPLSVHPLNSVLHSGSSISSHLHELVPSSLMGLRFMVRPPCATQIRLHSNTILHISHVDLLTFKCFSVCFKKDGLALNCRPHSVHSWSGRGQEGFVVLDPREVTSPVKSHKSHANSSVCIFLCVTS